MKWRRLYPPNWEELAYACKEAAGWCCEHCGVAHGSERVSERTGVVYVVYLAAAHLDHDPWNPFPRLAALCQSCHMSYDWSYEERQRWLELEVLRHKLWVERYLAEEQEYEEIFRRSCSAEQ
jgi:hypothetical protein